MAMGGRNDDKQEEIVAEINMTPLIDIMLVLLIIFMVSSSAALESGLDVQLPEANAVTDKTEAILIVTLDGNGQMAVQGKKVTMEELEVKITEGLAELKTDAVILEGDGSVNLTQAMQVMDLAKTAGAKNFSIAATVKDK